ncbi:hypothetical protein OEZ85_008335 [Tetradesmus obliquus]|uniref:Uncharacterized protein n=1 Tax=Tetradesmus obliquus TaxID=3088 RepID=A0ABY8TKM1_TETOB|nr:hypothetical protein OEZ85_008335 [Tetradesmus obliquus]
MGKKRKFELDLDVERNMYSSFVTAANAVSQLYTQGVQQQRRAAAAASRATLEKVLNFVLRENAGGEHISKAALVQFLQHEYENADGQDAPPPQPQMHFMPFGPAAAAAAAAAGSDDSQDVQQPKQPGRQLSGGMAASPGLRAPGRMMSMEEQQQQHQQQQQQQQHPHMPQQQQQQMLHLQQQEAQAADAMQVQHHGMMHMAASPFTGAQAVHGMQFMQPGNGMQ